MRPSRIAAIALALAVLCMAVYAIRHSMYRVIGISLTVAVVMIVVAGIADALDRHGFRQLCVVVALASVLVFAAVLPFGVSAVTGSLHYLVWIVATGLSSLIAIVILVIGGYSVDDVVWELYLEMRWPDD